MWGGKVHEKVGVVEGLLWISHAFYPINPFTKNIEIMINIAVHRIYVSYDIPSNWEQRNGQADLSVKY